jgi:hypothetical protein
MQTTFLAASLMKNNSPYARATEELPAYAGPFQGLKDVGRVGAVLGGMVLYAGLLGALFAR